MATTFEINRVKVNVRHEFEVLIYENPQLKTDKEFSSLNDGYVQALELFNDAIYHQELATVKKIRDSLLASMNLLNNQKKRIRSMKSKYSNITKMSYFTSFLPTGIKKALRESLQNLNDCSEGAEQIALKAREVIVRLEAGLKKNDLLKKDNGFLGFLSYVRAMYDQFKDFEDNIRTLKISHNNTYGLISAGRLDALPLSYQAICRGKLSTLIVEIESLKKSKRVYSFLLN